MLVLPHGEEERREVTPAEQVDLALGRQLHQQTQLAELLRRGRRMDAIQVDQLWKRIRGYQREEAEAIAWLEAVELFVGGVK